MTRNNKIAALKAATKIVMVKPSRVAQWEFTLVFDNGYTINVDVDELQRVKPTSTKPTTLADYLRLNRHDWYSDRRGAHTRIKITGVWNPKLYSKLKRMLSNHPDVILVEREALGQRADMFESWRTNQGAYRIIIRSTVPATKIFVNY